MCDGRGAVTGGTPTFCLPADEVGHDIATKITIGGYKEATVGGYTFVTTIKTNRRLVLPGHIYGFADKTALGKFLILTAPKFWLTGLLAAGKRTETCSSQASVPCTLPLTGTAKPPGFSPSKGPRPVRRHLHDGRGFSAIRAHLHRYQVQP